MAVTGRKRTLALGGVIEIQTASVALKFTVHNYSSIIHKGTQKIGSDFNKAF